jgi:hypothetical protein
MEKGDGIEASHYPSNCRSVKEHGNGRFGNMRAGVIMAPRTTYRNS